jgi:pilus assembly protein CpaD
MPAPDEIAPMPAMRFASIRALDRLACLAVLAGLLACGGCASPVDRAVAVSPVAEDYHLRHPVVLADAPQRLDIFFVGQAGVLDVPQARQLEAFARDFLSSGQGPMQIALPSGAADRAGAERTLSAVRRTLLRLGVRSGVSVTTYPVHNPAIATPLHLSFLTLQARPTTRCGQWPDDLGSGATLATWDNRSYYNLGCANQQTLAAQVADPRDLVKPRALDPTDVQLRTRAIGLLRGDPSVVQGTDPSTPWSNNPVVIGPVGQF